MRVYIASKYIDHKDLNQEIYGELNKAGIEAFLPESINIDAIDRDEMYIVSETCYHEIEQSDIILAVCPFGKSVSSELGYAIALKRRLLKNIQIVVLNMDFCSEAMIYPYVDKSADSIEELIGYLKQVR